MKGSTEQPARAFQFDLDTFGYAHELVWQYRWDPVTGAMSTFPTDPRPTYYHHCFVMARSTRQFFQHARFDPGSPAVEPEAYRRLIRAVVSRNARRGCAESERIVIPGFEGLRPFSLAHEPLLKRNAAARGNRTFFAAIGAWYSRCGGGIRSRFHGGWFSRSAAAGCRSCISSDSPASPSTTESCCSD